MIQNQFKERKGKIQAARIKTKRTADHEVLSAMCSKESVIGNHKSQIPKQHSIRMQFILLYFVICPSKSDSQNLELGACNLGFNWDLVLGIWDFIMMWCLLFVFFHA
jgi:hypothetical protein